MDIVVRTPHGDADVTINARGPASTLGDVIGAVTGQAAPRLALVDGRAVSCSTLIGDAGLLFGSVVTTEPASADETTADDIDLVQCAGHGAGRIVRLRPGRYRIGPGRRSVAAELSLAPVEHATIDLTVESTSDGAQVTVAPHGDAPAALDGTVVSSATLWTSGTLTTDNRAFQFETRPISDREVPRESTDGTVEFSRPPRRRTAPPRRPVVDAVRDATSMSPALWERRPDHPDAFALPLGVSADGGATVTVDLSVDRAIAIVGSEHFRTAVARTLLVEATTLHGPADLDLAILTRPDRSAGWDWAKWLPHLRLDGDPAISSAAYDIARWAVGRAARISAPGRTQLSLVVIDDAALWSRRDSPLRALLASPPDDVRVIALCDDVARAPELCTLAVSETADGRTCLHSFDRVDDLDDVLAALTEVDVAARVARGLAPLVDVDLPVLVASPTRDDSVDLAELLGHPSPSEVERRWRLPDVVTAVTIGTRDGQGVELSTTGTTVVVGSSIRDAFDVAASAVLARCTQTSPQRLWIVPVADAGNERTELLWALPHAVQRFDTSSPFDVDRLARRADALLEQAAGPDQVIVVIETLHADRGPLSDERLQQMLAAAATTRGLDVIVITDRHDLEVGVDEAAMVEVGHSRSTITSGSEPAGIRFTPFRRTSTPVPVLDLRPLVVGRALSPLERRLGRHHARMSHSHDPALDAIVELLAEVGANRPDDPDHDTDRIIIPPPLPTGVDLDVLFSSWPGDAVPIGLVDDPTSTDVRALWWEPGSGGLLLFGSRRSGVDHVATTVMLGIIDRFAGDDVRLVLVDASERRRRIVESTGHDLGVVAADRPDAVEQLLDDIVHEVERRADGPGGADPQLVVVVSDLVDLRRRFAETPLGERIDVVLADSLAHGSGVDVIAYVSDTVEGGAYSALATRRLVGACTDWADMVRLGVEQPAELDGIVGRCRSFPGGDLVQVATSDVPFETLFARRSDDETMTRPDPGGEHHEESLR